MTTGSDPLHMAVGFQYLRRDLAAFQERAPHHLPGIGRIVVAIERLADHRANTVRGDHDIRLDRGAIGEAELDRAAAIVYGSEPVTKMDRSGIDALGESIEKIGAVESVVRRTVAQRFLAQVAKFERLSGLHVARENAGRQIRDGGDLLAKSDRL